MRKRILFHVLLACLSAISLAQSDSFSLLKTFKKGEEVRYAIHNVIQADGVEPESSAVTSRKIIEASKAGYTVEVTTKYTDGQAASYTAKYGPRGEFKSVNGSDQQYRTYALKAFISPQQPVKIGDSWTYVGPSDLERGIQGFKSDYKLVGKEKLDGAEALKVTWSGKETTGGLPAVVKAEAWLDPRRLLC